MASYADIAYADTYLAAVPEWNLAAVTDLIKQRALDLGTVAIDASVTWAEDVVPGDETAVKQANCELALAEVDGRGIYADSTIPVLAEQEDKLGELSTKTRYRATGSSGRSSILTRFPVVQHILYGLIDLTTTSVVSRA